MATNCASCRGHCWFAVILASRAASRMARLDGQGLAVCSQAQEAPPLHTRTPWLKVWSTPAIRSPPIAGKTSIEILIHSWSVLVQPQKRVKTLSCCMPIPTSRSGSGSLVRRLVGTLSWGWPWLHRPQPLQHAGRGRRPAWLHSRSEGVLME